MTVLYCVVQTPPSVDLPPGGLPGAGAPRALPLKGGLTAIVATLPDRDYSEDAVSAKLRDMAWVSSAALGHEQLLEHVMRTASAVLPMKLLTLFSGDDRLVQDLTRQRKRLERAAAQVAGCDEYGLRLVALDGSAEPPQGAGVSKPASGTAFLERKKQVRDVAREQASRRAAYAADVFDGLSGVSRDAVARPLQADDAERPLLDAAFLVARDEQQHFGAAAEALAARAADAHCLFKLTGPWPPYHFVQVDDAS